MGFVSCFWIRSGGSSSSLGPAVNDLYCPVAVLPRPSQRVVVQQLARGRGEGDGDTDGGKRKSRSNWRRRRPRRKRSDNLDDPEPEKNPNSQDPVNSTDRFPKRNSISLGAGKKKKKLGQTTRPGQGGAKGRNPRSKGRGDKELLDHRKLKEKFFTMLISRSRDAFRFAHENQYIPDQSDLNDFLSRLSKQKLIGVALEVIREAEITWRLIPPKNVKTAILVIDIYGKAKMLDKAIRTFDFIESTEGGTVNSIAYNALVAACARSNRPDLSFAVIDKMRARGLRPDKFTFGSVIDALGKVGDVEKAFEVADRMEAEGIRMDQASYSALIDACGRSGRLDSALLLFEDMKSHGVWPNVITFAVLVEACAEADDPDRAFEIFREMRQWNIKPNVVIYTCLVDACCKSGRMDKASEVLSDMRANGVFPNAVTYSCIIHGYCSVSDLDSALEMLEAMTDDDCTPNGKLLMSLVHHVKNANRLDLVSIIWMVHMKNPHYMAPGFYLKLLHITTMIGNVKLGVQIGRRATRESAHLGVGHRLSYTRALSELLGAAEHVKDEGSARAISGLINEIDPGSNTADLAGKK
eukprot:CAMPEP_0113957840 /NCGR_PEP_ID=MMETSP0011_2-20120614/3004_1 /TAXON_ID=101924 /ORGANISM="Rhodosorus marinus" /LENGTH=580 /DNA_ID=CAMNT_0000968469 /DNA_START=214 /DNA_END=1956 /DNA_ORIENTATION=+ /assembly_acc=CAM_ASM_000156